ncbi:hypothetical protein Sjap_007493 [Stephania japonica]|uniref:AIG1-type G domain-containing protein n=1 Tax=Stephania japonica TaxID=461633 RepID=A0AAP0PBD4_9MAGN
MDSAPIVSLSPTQQQDETTAPEGTITSTSTTTTTTTTTSTYPPIRAPPSSDHFDAQNPHKALKTNGLEDPVIGSVSGSSEEEAEEGFVSGEEDFETASERPFLPDPDLDVDVDVDETLELDTVMPKVRLSGEAPPRAPLLEGGEEFDDEGLVAGVTDDDGDDDDDDDGDDDVDDGKSEEALGVAVGESSFNAVVEEEEEAAVEVGDGDGSLGVTESAVGEEEQMKEPHNAEEEEEEEEAMKNDNGDEGDGSLKSGVESGHDKTEPEGQVNEPVAVAVAAAAPALAAAAAGGAEIESDGLEGRDETEEYTTEEENEGMTFEGSETAKQIMRELAQASSVASQQRIDGQQIIVESDEEVDTDEDEEEGSELFDSAALTALLKAASSARSGGGDSVTITSSDGSRLFSVERPAGLGSSIRSLRPAPRPNRPNLFAPTDLSDGRESDDKLTDEEKKKLEKIQQIRVKFLRLLSRIGHSPEDSIAAQVLYRLVLASGRHSSQAFSLEAAKAMAMQLEAANGKDELDFSLNILILGKTGVGKSATINSIFGEEKAVVGAFDPATTHVKEIVGLVDGVKIRVIDTPGLRSSVMEQAYNQKILSSVKRMTKKCPPDILLYVDRLDTQTRDLNDLPLLRSITGTLGSSIWRSAIVTLTHAASAPPDGPSGAPLSYEVFVAQRSHIVQQAIGQAVGDLRMMNPNLMNPVSLVENHPSCRKNRDGHKVLPNGQTWRPQLLVLCCSLKVLSEASSLSKPQDPFDHRKLFGFRVRSPPLPYLLSSLLQSRAHPKLPAEQGESVDSDIELDDLSDSDHEEEEEEYDQLPPFKPLRKSQIAKLSKDQRKAYFDEYDYRVKLLQKKQWKEELRRMREMKKRGKSGGDNLAGFTGEDADQENGPAAVPVPLPDMVLPPSFDADNPAYRYRFLEPTSQLLARPVLDTHGWDHDCGYDGVSLEESLAIAGKFPAGVVVQITKDKKEFNVHLESSVAAKHGENGSTLAGFDVQNIGKQLAYIVKGETKFKNFKKNKTAAGMSITFLGENVVTGLKIEDQISIGKRIVLVGSTGTVRSQGDAAYGANLEARFKDKDFPIGQDLATLGLSLMKWRGDLALGANLQSQFSIGRSSKMSLRVGLNNKLSGQITVKTSSSEQLQLALVGLLPVAMAIYRSVFPAPSESFSSY